MTSLLDEFLIGAGERSYRDFVQFHLRRHSAKHHKQAIAGEISRLDATIQCQADSYVRYLLAYPMWDIPLWHSFSCREALESIITAAIRVSGDALPFDSVQEAMKPEHHEITFCLFQIATLTFALETDGNRDARKFTGIRKGIFG